MASLKKRVEKQKKHLFVYLQFIDDNSKVFKKGMIKIPHDTWDDKKEAVKPSLQNSIAYNNIVRTMFNDYESKLLALQAKGKIFGTIFKDEQEEKTLLLTDYLQCMIDEIYDNSKTTSWASYKTLKTHLINFSPVTTAADIDENWVKKFVRYLNNYQIVSKKTGKTKGLSPNTIVNNLGYFRELVKFINLNSHHQIKVNIKPGAKQKTFKSKWTTEEIQKLEEVDLSKHLNMQLSKDVWFMQYHLRGSRVGEALSLEKSNIKDGSILVSQSKSSGKKFKLIQVTEKIQEILDRYDPKSKDYIKIEDIKAQMKQGWGHSKRLQMAGNASPYIFPLLENYPPSPYEIQLKYRIINNHLQAIAEMAGVNKKITTHTARHSFAKKAKGLIDIPTIQLLLGHTELTTTMAYLDELDIEEQLNEATRKIFE